MGRALIIIILKFYGGVEFGTANIDLSSSVLTPLTATCSAGGHVFPNEVWLDFNGTTYDVYSDPYITWVSSHNLTDFNGTIMTDVGSNQNIHVRGTVNGKITILADEDLFIEDDVVCANNPSVNPLSDDYIA